MLGKQREIKKLGKELVHLSKECKEGGKCWEWCKSGVFGHYFAGALSEIAVPGVEVGH